MKKKFELNLDAVVVLTLLFLLALGMNFVQYRVYVELAAENRKLQSQGLVDRLNLESQQDYIDRLKKQQLQVASE